MDRHVDDSAGQGPAPAFADGWYDYATQRWYWDDQMFTMLGLHDEGVDPTQLVFERMHPADAPVVRAALERAIAQVAPVSGQYRLRDDEGVERTVAFAADVERDETGEARRLVGLAFDVSRASRLAADEAVMAATLDRAAIEQVKGALMFTYGVDADAAFGLLVRYSQRGNVKLAVVARRVAALLAAQSAPGTEQSMLRVLEAALRPAAVVEEETG
ncbi:PAS and ANTAR domain-containing protein [Phycicoccus duodecadis]|jgi:hypothetical protein|uniref:PAS domain-containing protein n=1 Tax=Phycicoccus duodecadis TaxID=173053 RepID=A0A2N3YN43_9MICO|nr:PAS and ANTAR domain-containing protein [Phycicoccus duodecadis]PKW28277.1 PAS domain-containing protein [Phycicoccus duodecadis]